MAHFPSNIEASEEADSELPIVTETDFGFEETLRFFKEAEQCESEIQQVEADQPTTEIKDLNTACDGYTNRPKEVKCVLVHRESKRFWDILCRQKFDLSIHDVNIRFAGEAAADTGGPLREFLTLSVQMFNCLNNIFFGASHSLAFNANT